MPTVRSESICARCRDCRIINGRSPDRLSAEQIKAYVAQRIGEGLKPRTTNVIVAAFKVFYRNALGKPELVDRLGMRPKKELLPRPIAPEDVERLIHATFEGAILAWRAFSRICQFTSFAPIARSSRRFV